MRKNLSHLLIILLLIGCSVDTAKQDTSYHYLPATAVSPEWIAPPATNESATGRKEQRKILALQQHASKPEIEQAVVEQKLEPELVAKAAGPDFTRTHYPVTYRLLDNVKSDCGAVVGQAKRYWHTTRPYLADSRVKALVPNPDTTGSYPSGHAEISRVWAEVLGQLVPQKREALRARAEVIAQHRVLAGMHYPRDIEGGKQLGLMCFVALQQTSGYQRDLQRAQEELRP